MEDTQKFSVARNGRVLGQYDAEWIRAALRDGTLNGSDHAIGEGALAWVMLRDHPKFAPWAPPKLPAKSSTPSAQAFRGPPHECRYCGGPLRKGRKATGTASGCFLMLLGLFIGGGLTTTVVGAIIGIPIGIITFLVGLHLGNKAEGFYQCKKCDAIFPRKIRFFEMG